MREDHPVLAFVIDVIVAIPFAITVAVMLLGGSISISIP